jgi:hypothetical protein
MAGSAGWGAAIGIATGAAGGFLYDQNQQAKEAVFQSGHEAGR